jgi:cobalamin synthase
MSRFGWYALQIAVIAVILGWYFSEPRQEQPAAALAMAVGFAIVITACVSWLIDKARWIRDLATGARGIDAEFWWTIAQVGIVVGVTLVLYLIKVYRGEPRHVVEALMLAVCAAFLVTFFGKKLASLVARRRGADGELQRLGGLALDSFERVVDQDRRRPLPVGQRLRREQLPE